MFGPEYRVYLSIKKDGTTKDLGGNACFSAIRNMGNIELLRIEIHTDKSVQNNRVERCSMKLLCEWLDIKVTYNKSEIIIDEGIHNWRYYFNLGIYLRNAFELDFVSVVPLYVSTFGREFDSRKLLVTQSYISHNFGFRIGHALLSGLHLTPSFSPNELKERFEKKSVFSSWQDIDKPEVRNKMKLMRTLTLKKYYDYYESLYSNK